MYTCVLMCVGFWSFWACKLSKASNILILPPLPPSLPFSSGYIDLSKRRVSPDDVIKCEERYNKAKAVHSVLRHVADQHGLYLEDLYKNVGWPLYRKHGHAFDAFSKVRLSLPPSLPPSVALCQLTINSFTYTITPSRPPPVPPPRRRRAIRGRIRRPRHHARAERQHYYLHQASSRAQAHQNSC